MRICFVVDAQSPHAIHWIRHMHAAGHEVHVISTYEFDREQVPCVTSHIVPVDFSAGFRGNEKAASMGTSTPTTRDKVIAKFRGTPMWKALAGVKNRTALKLITKRAATVREHIRSIQPDIVHSMRIPFEGLLACAAVRDLSLPFLTSTWGNDFTLFAERDKAIKRLTLEVLQRIDGIHCDCEKDVKIARSWGLAAHKPSMVAPGNGGIDANLFSPVADRAAVRREIGLPENVPVILNPRGLKEYIRNDTVFASMPLVWEQFPEAILVCASMAGKAQAISMAEATGHPERIQLLASMPREQLARYFQAADVVVSCSNHDGTPNSLLEGMSCGVFPCVSGIESNLEWVTSGVNGLVHDQTSPVSLANDLKTALADDSFRERAARENRPMVQERAGIETSVAKLEEMYHLITQAKA